MKLIDDFLNKTTMYRLTLYYLIVLVLGALVFSFLGLLSFTPLALIVSVSLLLACCWLTNTLFAEVFKVPANLESVYISALILALIIRPAQGISDLFFLFWAGVLAMASKYIFVRKGSHLFNPVALAVFLTAVILNQSANWWVGTRSMLLLVFLGGLLVIRKTQKEALAVSFLVTAVLTILISSFLKGSNFASLFRQLTTDTPFFFFVFVMLTEPLTLPAGRKLQMIYGGLVGMGFYYLPPETALLIGNIFSFLANPKIKLILKLKEKRQIAPDIYDFIFTPDKKLNFLPGQYLEWTLKCDDIDSRGNRRYFTLSSSPTEEEIRIGVKFSPNSSSFKKALLAMSNTDEIAAAGLAGDFVLPDNKQRKYVFMAGGIGITPFRSMIKYLLDTNQSQDIVLFYANRTAQDIVYQKILNRAEMRGIRTIYTLTDINNLPLEWQGEKGRIDKEIIARQIPDYQERLFYLSGPHGMVTSFEETLEEMGIKKDQIKTDYFPGFG